MTETTDRYLSRPQTSSKCRPISDLVAELEKDPKDRAALEEGRRWVADTFYGEGDTTMRAMRLRKGWSQAYLANIKD